MESNREYERMLELVDKINELNYEYYQNDRSLISDYEFDNLLLELQEIENKHPDWILPYSPTQRVGGTITKNFKTVSHRYPMLSLANTYNEEEIRDFEERILKIIKEAAEQSGRLIIPKFLEIQKFEDAVSNLKNNGLNLFFDPNGEKLKNFEKEILNHKLINVFIGPEGGWSEKEINLAKENGFLIANLGNFTLRAETAAICSTFFIHLL